MESRNGVRNEKDTWSAGMELGRKRRLGEQDWSKKEKDTLRSAWSGVRKERETSRAGVE
jgi:hypothetical protein